MPSPSFNSFQQTFALSWASNLVGTCTGSAAEIQDKLNKALSSDYLNNNVGPGWSVVWGPAIWQHNPNPEKPAGPDNVWFIAKHDSFVTEGQDPKPAYVVCIAGTAGTGEGFDGTFEDVAVGRVVDLNQWIPDGFTGDVIPSPAVASDPDFTGSTPYVSYGTSIGTYVIASMSPVALDGQASTHSSVSAFLKNEVVAPGTRLIFTGHSLGAALCPTLAFVLDKAQLLSNFSKVLVYPTAGATPGDSSFVSAFSRRFPAIPPAEGQPAYMTWNENIVNSLDIVPHAWCTLSTYPQNLNVIPTIYGNSPQQGFIPFSILTVLKGKLVTPAKNAWPEKPKQNVYIPLPSSVFSSGQEPFPTTQAELETRMMFCHIRAYIDLICGPDFKFTPGPCATVANDEHIPVGLSRILEYVESLPDDPERLEKYLVAENQ
ncbi:unnamed protein product [Rhizoctonia solani]|uniref:Fungal lipase-type domain-containing protein n=1 Tax=Rhizoctonia solani TaxID=456999 RepID=A0A8H3C542_9AGAM|nr:unnamed protein product [Rhizoctonia solani]